MSPCVSVAFYLRILRSVKFPSTVKYGWLKETTFACSGALLYLRTLRSGNLLVWLNMADWRKLPLLVLQPYPQHSLPTSRDPQIRNYTGNLKGIEKQETNYFIKASIHLHLILNLWKQVAFAMHMSVNFGWFNVTKLCLSWPPWSWHLEFKGLNLLCGLKHDS